MSKRTIFLGWDGAVVDKALEYLIAADGISRESEVQNAPLDLEKMLLVVPTTQAGRRLRERLAVYCGEKNSVLLAARTVTPAWFLRNSDIQSPSEINKTTSQAVWADILLGLNADEYNSLFPAKGLKKDYAWALDNASMLNNLRRTLTDAGLSINGAAAICGDAVPEKERWRAMGRLEGEYLARVRRLGLSDPCELEIARAATPEISGEINRIVMIAVPWPTPLMVRAMENIAKIIDVEVLIHAPQDIEDCFDEWGRPIPAKWNERDIAIPDAESNLILAASPLAQADTTVGLIAGAANRFGPADIAIGVPDRTVIPCLETILEEHGLPTFDPSEKSIVQHPICRILEFICRLVTEDTYEQFATLVRHPDMLTFFEKTFQTSAARLLTDLDEFQNVHLPINFTDMEKHFTAGKYIGSDGDEFSCLASAIILIRKQLDCILSGNLIEAIRSFLTTIFSVQTITDNQPADKEFSNVASVLNDVLAEIAALPETIKLDNKRATGLLMNEFTSRTYARERTQSILDLEGWLELHWNNAPFLIVTGMNDGAVPDSQLSDVFVPDSLRKILGLPDDGSRLARDAYIMKCLIESRRKNGRIVFITGKNSNAGDPLKPSRLLFNCDGDELLNRTKKLFGDVNEIRKNYPFNVSFKLDPRPPSDFDPRRLDLTRMSATRFRDYLNCPFRFYLKHILQMQKLDDEKRGLDDLDFGIMIHDVMQKMGKNKSIYTSNNPDIIRQYLEDCAEEWVTARFGANPSLSVIMLLDSARQRLAAAARTQAELVDDGWEIAVQPEQSFSLNNFHGVEIFGRIDRIDKNRRTGAVRIIDYKTSDKAGLPEKMHIVSASDEALDYTILEGDDGGKRRMWRDLQLPIYRMLVDASGQFSRAPEIKVAYFCLPKAVGETGVYEWENFGDDLLESARDCAGAIVEAVKVRKFWPPARSVSWDDYQDLYVGDITDFVWGLDSTGKNRE